MIRRFYGYNPLTQARGQMDRLFEDFLDNGVAALMGTAAFPPLNIWEDADNVHIESELPGMKLEDLEIYVTGNELTMKGQRRDDDPGQTARFHRRERGMGAFNRVVHLPVDVEADKVTAQLINGVLHMTLPKSAQARPRKIEVVNSTN